MYTAYWPEEAPRAETLDAFIKAFETLGYQTCSAGEYEEDFEKVAIYVDANGKPTHAARQLSEGFWTSKLGQLEDIAHAMEGVSGLQYGTVAVFMKRTKK